MAYNKITPIISVIMPVYNAQDFLNKSIESVLDQTFIDFEFIIINDASNDKSEEIILSYTDNRIKYYSNSQNFGIVFSLNLGLKVAKGKYIARMDSDDISFPNRFEHQLAFMEKNKDVVVCGAQAILINENDEKIGRINVPIKNDEIKVNMLFNNSFIHPLTFFRSDILKYYQYDMKYQYAEDYFLFAKICSDYEVANLCEDLLYYRLQEKSITATRKNQMTVSRCKVYNYLLNSLLGYYPNKEFVKIFADLRSYQIYSFDDYKLVLETMLTANNKNKGFNIDIFSHILHNEYFSLLKAKQIRYSLFLFFSSSLFNKKYFTFKQFRKLFKQLIYIN